MGSMVLRMLASNPLTDCVDECAKAGIGLISAPTFKRDGLHFTESERQIDRIETQGQIGAPSFRLAGFVAYELAFRSDRPSRPCHQDAFGSFEMFFDVTAPVGAAADMRVPPDVEAFGLKRSNKRLQTGAVLGLVRDENIRR